MSHDSRFKQIATSLHVPEDVAKRLLELHEEQEANRAIKAQGGYPRTPRTLSEEFNPTGIVVPTPTKHGVPVEPLPFVAQDRIVQRSVLYPYPEGTVLPVEKTPNDSGFITKDSGQREAFATGMVRDLRDGKGRFDLLPTRALRRVAQVYERGAKKYGDSNWRKGAPFSRFLDSGIRHTMQALEGNQDEDHLAQAIFNLLAVIELQELIKEGKHDPKLNDIYHDET